MLRARETLPPPHVSSLLLSITRGLAWIFHGPRAPLHVTHRAQAQFFILDRQSHGTDLPLPC